MAALLIPTLFVSGAVGQVADKAQPNQPYIVIVTADFDDTNVFSVVSADDFKTLKKDLQAERKAASKAYQTVKNAWNDRYAKPIRRTPGIVPSFPLARVPVKKIEQLEVCKTLDAANERMLFYRKRADETELKDRGSSKSLDKIQSSEAQAAEAKTKAELIRQFAAELKRLLAGAADQPSVKKGGLGDTRVE